MSGWPRWARWPPGWPRAQQPRLGGAPRRRGPGRVAGGARLDDRGVRGVRDRARAGGRARRAAAPGDAGRAGRPPLSPPGCRRRRGRAVRHAERARARARRRGWPSRWPRPAWTRPSLARVAELAGAATPAAVGWIAASLSARELADELIDSTQRMSGLVKAIKRYAYMDRGELVEVDLREGLETTLTILGHKLKHTTITVQARLRRVAARVPGPRRRAQPGVDQSAGQRDRRAR